MTETISLENLNISPPLADVSHPRLHGDEFTPAKAGVLRISNFISAEPHYRLSGYDKPERPLVASLKCIAKK